MKQISVKRDDVLKNIYFITAIVQKQGSSSMQGVLSSKGDLMGGIFDRWINTITESTIFNKILLPEIENCEKVKIVSDYYLYDPKITGIAPDVLGLTINDKTVPFVIFEEGWKEVPEMPQIEVKTYKKNQKMISLRNQNYNDEYLVMAETSFHIDYLLPFFDQSIFSKEMFTELNMNNQTFIKSNKSNLLHDIEEIDLSKDDLGTVTLLKVTSANDFMQIATLCEERVSVQYIDSIEKKNKEPKGSNLSDPLSKYCIKNDQFNNLYHFNEHWYTGYTKDKIPYHIIGNDSHKVQLIRTLDFYTDNIDAITVIKKSKNIIYIKTAAEIYLNNQKLESNSIYSINFNILARSSSNNTEYFFQKSIIELVTDKKEELKNVIKNIVSKENKL